MSQRFTISLTASLRVRHHLPPEATRTGTRHARATEPHTHLWNVRAYWPSDLEAHHNDLDDLDARLRAFVADYDGTDLNDGHHKPTTEWFAALICGSLHAARVDVLDEEGRLVTCETVTEPYL